MSLGRIQMRDLVARLKLIPMRKLPGSHPKDSLLALAARRNNAQLPLLYIRIN